LKNITVYQTLSDRDNPDHVLKHGPFQCTHKKSWLGSGYYFWDTFIENAHWWGKDSLKSPYIVCEAIISIDSNSCFDLVGNTDHMLEFEKAYEFLKSKKIADSKSNVSRVINYLRTIKAFTFDCIRVNGINSKSKYIQPNYQLKFQQNSIAHFEYKPPIQICVFNLEKVNFREYKIVHPDHYIENYLI